MWKSYNRFYGQTIKSEFGLLFALKNASEVPSLKKVTITCLSKNPSKTKRILMALSCLQLFVKKKAQVVTAKKSTVATKVRQGQPLGAKVVLNHNTARQFLHFVTFFLMPRLDLTSLFFVQERNSDFKFFVKTATVFSRLRPFFTFYQFLPLIQVVLSVNNIPNKGQVFFWRLNKIPVFLQKTP